MTKTYNDALEAVQRITRNGYPHQQFNIAAIVKDFHHRFGHYDITAAEISSHTFWAIAEKHNLTLPEGPFNDRDWDAPEYAHISPRDRYEVADGPAQGDVTSVWQPGFGITIDLPRLGPHGDGLGVSLTDARRLLQDLQTVINKIDQ